MDKNDVWGRYWKQYTGLLEQLDEQMLATFYSDSDYAEYIIEQAAIFEAEQHYLMEIQGAPEHEHD